MPDSDPRQEELAQSECILYPRQEELAQSECILYPRQEELAQSECILYRNMFSPIFISHYKSIKNRKY